MNDLKQQLAPGWSPVNIGLTVVLMWAIWPLGIMMVVYNVWGHKLNLDLRRPATFSHLSKRLFNALKAAKENFLKNP